ncbi:MAG: UPF0755 protein [Parcubacteria group bacterium Athens0714_24]|nr:MAG: UPF0755 protein [Parcubacteria group bacterium Athens0714_24]
MPLSQNSKVKIFTAFILFIAVLLCWFYFSQTEKLNNFALVPLRVTIPEGYDLKDIAGKFKVFKNFDVNNFLSLASKSEGRLFPDTYFLTGTEDETDIIKIMRDNFYKKIGKIDDDILIMASILEREAKTKEDMEIISGILWKRIKVGMPLQVDSVPETYSYKGFPPAPICNPGLKAINAAKNPVESPYWYYLSDKKGNIHYAKTLDEQNANKAKYLR